MDPLSQGLLGVTAARNVNAVSRQRVAVVTIGMLAGMAADLDVLIRSDSDPLLFLEYHRQFTHSLIFIPVAGLLLGLLLYPLIGRRLGIGQSIVLSTLAYATHGLLDACTSYGTQLLWPFSDARIAWNVLSIVDPLYTLPLLLLCGLSLRDRGTLLGGRSAARLALCWALLYPMLGWWQRERAEDAAWAIAQARGHHPTALSAKPSLGNILLWKTVYRDGDRFYVDAVRVGAAIRVYPGENIAELDIQRDLPWLPTNSVQARDVARFAWFSQGYLAHDPAHPTRIIDIRYSLLPNEIQALWSIELNASAPNEHVEFQTHRDNASAKLARLWDMLAGY